MKLGSWSSKEDPGEMLIEEAKSQNSKNKMTEKLPKEWKELAQKCLHRKSSVRIGIRQWLNEWDPQISLHSSFYRHQFSGESFI